MHLILALVTALITNTHAISHDALPLRARNESSPALHPPTLNVTVTFPNGTDITSSVRVMLYHEPKVHADSDLNARYTPGLSRPQNECVTKEGENPPYFAYSHCARDGGGSMQQFVMYCYPPRPTKKQELSDTSSTSSSSSSSDGDSPSAAGAAARRRSKLPYSTMGMCAPTEICMDGHGDGNYYNGRKMRKVSDAQLAFCISHELFIEIAMRGTTEDAQSSSSSTSSSSELPALEGEQARMVFSNADATTAVEVQAMDLVAHQPPSSSSSDSDSSSVVHGVAGKPADAVQASCAECVDLFSRKFEPGIDELKAEATVMQGVGTAAAAAVLWIEIISG